MAYLKSLSRLCLFAYISWSYAAMGSCLNMCIPYAAKECMKRCHEGQICHRQCHKKVKKPCKDACEDLNVFKL